MSDAGEPDEQALIETLYRAALPEFVALRKVGAQRLRKAGQREAATRVQALGKPSVPAWLANQLFHEAPVDWNTALDAGEALREAQRGGGITATEMQEKLSAQQQAVQRLVQRADALAAARAQKVSRAHLRKLQDTLEAFAAGTAEGEPGRLQAELAPPSFDALDAAALLAAEPPRRAPVRAAAQEPEVGAEPQPAPPAKRPAASPPRSPAPAPKPTRAAAPRPLPPMPDPAELREANMALQHARSRQEAARIERERAETAAHAAVEGVERARAQLGVAQRRLEQAEQALSSCKQDLLEREQALSAARQGERTAAAATSEAQAQLERLRAP